jgi:coenzyme F420-reducing hydrogenase beta subunit
MIDMNRVCSADVCVGCAACSDICPMQCISMKFDGEGFFTSVIDEKSCVDCERCYNVCPAISIPKGNHGEFDGYMCWNKDANIRIRSSSGGVFSWIADYVLEQDGLIYGAAFDNKFNLKHIGISSKQDLHQLRGSKYIGSDLRGIYRSIKNDLESGKFVLFSGTPCQNAALKNYLPKDYEKLITCDFLCHGVGSTKYFNDCLNYLERKYDSNIEHISFRKKNYGYLKPIFEVRFNNKKVYKELYYLSIFGYFFANSICNRRSCGSCKYATSERSSDFTMADYGCFDKYKQPLGEIKKGISTLLVNTDKGRKIFEQTKNKLVYKERPRHFIVSSSPYLQMRTSVNTERELFFDEYFSLDFDEFVAKNYRISKKERNALKYDGKWYGNPAQFVYKLFHKICAIIRK